MSREFNGTDAVLTRSAGVITAFPFSLSVWYRPTSLTGGNKVLLSGHDNPSASIQYSLELDSFQSWKPTLFLYDGTYRQATAGGSGSSTNIWQHAGVVVASASNYSVFYDGANKGTGTTPVSMTLSNLNRISVGRWSPSASGFFSGALVHCAVWSAALTDAEVAVLYAGLLPTRVRPASLLAYWSLSGKDSPEIDIVGRNDLTVTNATVSNEEPRIFRNYA